MTQAQLRGETDLAGFHAEVRQLLTQQVPPEAVQWEACACRDDLYLPQDPSPRTPGPGKAAAAIVPASFLRLSEVVLMHSDPGRFDLLYRLLWRLVHEPGLRHDPVDPQMLQAQQMGQAVRRDLHKMKTLLRFRNVVAGGHPILLAWHEPAHHIVEALGPWFALRHPGARWAILTPGRCVECDGRSLHVAPGLARAFAPAEGDGPDAWLAAYWRAFDGQAIALDRAHGPRE